MTVPMVPTPRAVRQPRISPRPSPGYLAKEKRDGIALATRAIVIVAAAIAAMGMMVLALWAWQGAGDMAADWDVARPDAVVWAIRSGAIAAAALAQAVIFGVVAGRIFPRRSADRAVVLAAAGMFVVAVVAAVVLAASGR